jgi:hypothetical protein
VASIEFTKQIILLSLSRRKVSARSYRLPALGMRVRPWANVPTENSRTGIVHPTLKPADKVGVRRLNFEVINRIPSLNRLNSIHDRLTIGRLQAHSSRQFSGTYPALSYEPKWMLAGCLQLLGNAMLS